MGSNQTSTSRCCPSGAGAPGSARATSNPERAARAAQLLRPRLAVPIHWGTFYPRGAAHRETGSPRLRANSPKRVAELAPEVTVRVLEPGESLAPDRLEVVRVDQTKLERLAERLDLARPSRSRSRHQTPSATVSTASRDRPVQRRDGVVSRERLMPRAAVAAAQKQPPASARRRWCSGPPRRSLARTPGRPPGRWLDRRRHRALSAPTGRPGRRRCHDSNGSEPPSGRSRPAAPTPRPVRGRGGRTPRRAPRTRSGFRPCAGCAARSAPLRSARDRRRSARPPAPPGRARPPS